MRRRRWARGGAAALILGSLALLLSGCSAHDVERDTRFGWPTGVTDQATRMRVLWSWAGLAALALGVVVWALIFWCCLRYRKRDEAIPRQTKYNFLIESICITVPLAIIIVLFWRTVVVEDYVNKLSASPNVLVQVDAFKWNWEFEYHTYTDASGKSVDAVYQNSHESTDAAATPGEPGRSYLDTVGSDDEIPVLVIPIGETVQFVEHSEDVIHSFWVPEFLFKRDVIPYGTDAQQKASGLNDNRFEITPTTTGSFVGRCAELCGTYHSQMNFEVRVVSKPTFLRYLAALNKLGPDDPARQHKALAAAGMTPYATTTYPFDTSRETNSASRPGGSRPLGS